MTPALVLAVLKQRELARLVSEALKTYHSTILLSRSPLADSALVLPGLIKDNLSPTAEERGQSLKLVLRWSVEQLAPEPPRYPIGVFRPYDDQSWADPAWWRYNILRHRYIEPLHPDEFVEGGRFTETLMALTGIPSTDTFFAERTRAVGEVGEWLQRQEATSESTEILRRTALDDALRSLREESGALDVLVLAALFEDAIPPELLQDLAADSGIHRPQQPIGLLIHNRFLLVGDDGTLWLSPILAAHLARRQGREDARVRHRRIAADYRRRDDILTAVHHYQRAGDHAQAAELMLANVVELTQDLDVEDIDRVAAAFDYDLLPSDQAIELLIVRADLNLALGQQDQALSACRAALPRVENDADLARLYRRLGKIFEQRSQRQALEYYAQAESYFSKDHPELVDMLKDRAWIQIERSAWDEAEADLTRALAQASALSAFVRADLHDATAGLYRYRGDTVQAVQHARRALALREEAGDLLGVAKSQLNLGLLFTAMDDYSSAVSMFKEALAVYQQLGNRELAAAALLNIGMAYHFMGDLTDAVNYYEECLALCRDASWHVTESRAYSNLVEAHAEQENFAAARTYWEQGVDLCRQSGLDSEIDYYGELLQRFPELDQGYERGQTETTGTPQPVQWTAPADADLDSDQRTALEIAHIEGSVTARALVDAGGVSKATATRKLAALVETGHLHKVGRGRNTQYRPAGIPVDVVQSGRETEQEEKLKTGSTPRSASIREVLVHQRVLIEQYYSVVGLGLLPAASATGDRLEFLVEFGDVPDLVTFFALEQRLGAILHRHVNLTPAFALDTAQGPTHSDSISWIWRRPPEGAS